LDEEDAIPTQLTPAALRGCDSGSESRENYQGHVMETRFSTSPQTTTIRSPLGRSFSLALRDEISELLLVQIEV
jgi:hypothetical protein